MSRARGLLIFISTAPHVQQRIGAVEQAANASICSARAIVASSTSAALISRLAISPASETASCLRYASTSSPENPTQCP